MKHPSRLAWFLLLALACASRGDVIKLKNGRTMDGLITRETDAAVTINVGVGEFVIKRSQIASIEKAGAEGRAAIEQEWQRHFYTHKNYVPKGWEAFAGEFNGLEQQRTAALKAQKDTARLKADIGRLMNEIRTHQRDVVALAHQIETAPAPSERATMEELEAYNNLIGRYNRLKGTMTLKADTIDKAEADLEAVARVPAEYLRAVSRFGKSYEARVQEGGLPTNKAAFFQQIDARLAFLKSEFKTFDVPYTGTNNASLVEVKLNDRATGRFVLDTGASAVSISRALAERLGLELDGAPVIAVTVADGKKVSATPVVLRAVQVGDARAENVPAIVLESAPGPEVDGLLGMTFLREFELRVDAAGHAIELTRLQGGKP